MTARRAGSTRTLGRCTQSRIVQNIEHIGPKMIQRHWQLLLPRQQRRRRQWLLLELLQKRRLRLRLAERVRRERWHWRLRRAWRLERRSRS